MQNLEITVKIKMELNELLEYLRKNNFRYHQSFRCLDMFLIKEEESKNIKTYEDLNKCIILRQLIFKDKTLRYLVKKEKQFDDRGNIINSYQENIPLENVNEAKINYLNEGYIELIRMDDYCYTFSKNGHEFIIEHISNLGTFIEFEDHNYDSLISNGNSIEELIELFKTFNIKYDDSDYFCKKAWLLLNKEGNLNS